MIKLYHDDCFNVFPTLEDKSIDLVLCDMPYGTTACKWDTVIDLEIMWEHLKRIVKDNTAIVLTSSQPFTSVLVMSNIKHFKCEWVWQKNRGSNFATTKYMPMKEHESVLIFSNKTVKYNPIKQQRSESGQTRSKYIIKGSNTGKRDFINNILAIDSFIDKDLRVPSSIQKFNVEVGLHPTQKPVSLMEYLIKTYSNEGDTVLDFCMGSGTTGVACKNLNRDFIGIEKEKQYYDIAKERIDSI
jgi:site-specific DNA-methyltransferase (adenine-specific)